MIKKSPLLIAEVGINHNGSLKKALRLIDMAKKCECDLVKFQKRTPDISTPNHMKNLMRETPWGNITYLDYKKHVELSSTEYDEINKYCQKKKIDWFASAWDLHSLKFLKKYKLKYNKVASAMISNVNLIKEIAKEKKLTFISTGGASFPEIDTAVKIFKKYKCKFIIMHCVASYPADEKELNLNLINTLKTKYRCTIGYSGHEKSVTPSVMAAALGAEVIERHITLDRTDWGTDQAASLEINGLNKLSTLLRKVNLIKGNGLKKNLQEESKKLKNLIYWK